MGLPDSEEKFSVKKEKSLLIADSFSRIGQSKKACEIRWCGTQLAFKKFSDNSLKLHSANFCRVRMCPMCTWRRSLKVYGQSSQIMDVLFSENEYRFLFLTLTIKNCPGQKLNVTIDQLFSGYDRLFKRRNIAKIVKGSFRSLEVSFNKRTDEFHPHLHCILAVSKRYFKDDFITHDTWMTLWKESLGIDYDPTVDIRSFKGNTEEEYKKSLKEVSKYSVKDEDILQEDPDLTDFILDSLSYALSGRRLVSYRGCFLKVKRALNLDDPEDGDLINTDNDQELRSDLEYIILNYRWNIGFGYYELVSIYDKESESV